MVKKHFISLLFIIGLLPFGFAQDSSTDKWVDDKYNSMSLDERIGQLFMIRAHSNLGPDHIQGVKDQIKKYHVGSLCFFQGTPAKQIELVNTYQQLSKEPLLVAMDAEWGLAMRFKEGVTRYPRNLMLGAIEDNALIYKMGVEVAKDLKRVGTNFNFAPVADINNNIKNPVINNRSFGENKNKVTAKAYMFATGLQDQNVLACAKHFPGHGDTEVDSHLDLPVIKHDLAHLKNMELFPFKALSDGGVKAVMVAHLSIPALDDRKNYPTTLSKKVVTDLLKKEMGFKGLIVTDALEMKGVSKYFPDGEVELKAIQAGNDILCLPNDIELAFKLIKEKLDSGELPMSRIEESCKKILKAKYELGLYHRMPLNPQNLDAFLNRKEAKVLKEELIKSALTLVRNDENLLPIKGKSRLAVLSFGAPKTSVFQTSVIKRHAASRHNLSKKVTASDKKRIHQELKDKDVVVISLHDMSKYESKMFGLNGDMISLIHDIAKNKKVILVVFGSPYSLKYFDNIGTAVMAYEEDDMIEEITAGSLFDEINFKGKMPVTASEKSKYNDGLLTVLKPKMKTAQPIELGFNLDSLKKVDELVAKVIADKAAPGAQLLIAKDGYIVKNKSYGYHSYKKKLPVTNSDIYDLASVTKIMSATLAVMKLVDLGLVDLDQPIKRYLPELANTNKANLVLRDVMAHRAGLKPWIPFYKRTVEGKRRITHKPGYYSVDSTAQFGTKVASDLYMRNDMVDTIYQEIADSDLRSNRNYAYSDLGFYLIAKIVKQVDGRPIDQFVKDEFYDRLGLENTLYNPHESWPLSKVAPTENDNYFRLETVQGYVHDMGAAMLGGVSGHAGLFSNTHDLAIIGQMLLQGGRFSGTRYLKETTVREFTTRHPKELRRGIGFDMKNLKPTGKKKKCNIAPEASSYTFGHYGFTGTCIWMDPSQNLIYIFLSNRTFPSMRNNLLGREDYRSRIQSAIYHALENPVFTSQN